MSMQRGLLDPTATGSYLGFSISYALAEDGDKEPSVCEIGLGWTAYVARRPRWPCFNSPAEDDYNDANAGDQRIM